MFGAARSRSLMAAATLFQTANAADHYWPITTGNWFAGPAAPRQKSYGLNNHRTPLGIVRYPPTCADDYVRSPRSTGDQSRKGSLWPRQDRRAGTRRPAHNLDTAAKVRCHRLCSVGRHCGPVAERYRQRIGLNAGGSSLDNTIRLIRLTQTKWILAEISIQALDSGLGHGDVRMFAEDGRLLALASQSLILRTRERSSFRTVALDVVTACVDELAKNHLRTQ